MSLGTGASRLVESGDAHQEGGFHGNPEVATTHLGTITLKDSLEYLPTHKETLTPTHGQSG